MLAQYASNYDSNASIKPVSSQKNKTRKSNKETLEKMKNIINRKETFEQQEKESSSFNLNQDNNDNDDLADFYPLTDSYTAPSNTYNNVLFNENNRNNRNNNSSDGNGNMSKEIEPTNSDYQDKFVENFEKLKYDKNLNIKSYQDSYLPYYNKMSHNTDNITKNELIEKLDYIINLLEDEKSIKTGHVTEELILYCFLGVFIIFIVDSFARTGKYRR